MDRRDFLKKSALVAAGAAVSAPVTAMLTSAENAGIIEEQKSESQPVTNNGNNIKVLLINGSPRHNGNTFASLDEAARQLKTHGIDTEIFQIGIQPMRYCLNCGACHRNGDNRCAFNDDICNTVIEKISKADALIVGTPVYYGQPNGGILSLMQRVFFAAGGLVQNKPAAAVAVCRRGGATATFQAMNMMFQMMNMPVVTSQYWNIVYGCDKGEAKLDEEGMQTMRTLADNMAFLLRSIHTAGLASPKREAHKFMNFIR